MFLPVPINVHDGRDFREFPLVNSVLVAINVLVFWIGWQPTVGQGAFIFSTLTYAFGHANASHLIGNMLALLVFGMPANRRLGNAWYLLVYLGSAWIIGLFAWVCSPHGLIGASGAIYAIIMVVVLLLPSARVEIVYLALFPFTVLLGIFQRPKHWLEWILRIDRLKFRAVWGLVLVPFLEFWGLLFTGWNWTNLGHLLGVVCGVAAVLLLPVSITMGRWRTASA